VEETDEEKEQEVVVKIKKIDRTDIKTQTQRNKDVMNRLKE